MKYDSKILICYICYISWPFFGPNQPTNPSKRKCTCSPGRYYQISISPLLLVGVHFIPLIQIVIKSNTHRSPSMSNMRDPTPRVIEAKIQLRV